MASIKRSGNYITEPVKIALSAQPALCAFWSAIIKTDSADSAKSAGIRLFSQLIYYYLMKCDLKHHFSHHSSIFNGNDKKVYLYS